MESGGLPFGEEIGAIDSRPGCFGGDSVPEVKFTGKERDGRTGLDYFGARYFSGTQGRWTSPDQPFADQHPEDPQSWNMYGYVRNKPLNHFDPNGRQCEMIAGHCGAANLPRHQPTVKDVAVAGAATVGVLGGAALAPEAGGLLSTGLGAALYNLAIRFFNSPGGQATVQTAGDLMTGSQTPGLVPLGFSGPAAFGKFSATLASGLEEAGADGAAFLTGSAVTGKSFATGAAFDVGRVSDFDIALVSKSLLGVAKDLGLSLRSGGTRTGPLSAQELKALGLNNLQQTLSKQAGRAVNFMIYESSWRNQ